MSSAAIAALLSNLNADNVKAVLAQYVDPDPIWLYSCTNTNTKSRQANIELTDAEVFFIQSGYSTPVAIARVISARAGLGWTTTGHTGTWAYV